MIYALLIFWIICALFMVHEKKVYRMIIFLSVFSLINSAIFLVAGAADVSMAEAAAGAFTTIFLLISLEKYYDFDKSRSKKDRKMKIDPKKLIPPILFSGALFLLFWYFMPPFSYDNYMKYQYITYFNVDVGGYNPVGAILLGYRVYDTLFEALILLVAIVAVKHVSWYDESYLKDGQHNEVELDPIAVYTIRAISPIILLFGIAMTTTSLDTPGGGFQGGVILAGFFICRYLIHNVYDIPIKLIALVEKLIYIAIVLVPVLVIFIGLQTLVPEANLRIFHNAFLTLMNTLLGMKVTCGFIILFYRYIVIDRRNK